jgi:stage II sporulation protein D
LKAVGTCIGAVAVKLIGSDKHNMKLAWCVCGLVVAGVAAGCAPVPSPAPRPAGSPALRVQVAQQGNAIRRVALEDYVRASIISEYAPPAGDPGVVGRMLEVQAVIARTYALANRGRHAAQGFDLCSTTHCQLYEPSRLKTSRWAPAAAEAVRRTAGAVLWHDGAPVAALFHADCGGHTSTSVSAWGGTPRPYLKAVRDDGHRDTPHAHWTYAIPVDALAAALNADPRTRVGSRVDAIQVTARDASGRAVTVSIRGRVERILKGEELRAVLAKRFGPRGVRSTLFEIRRDGHAFVFDGRGFGHGVGLCQAGAVARIQAGATPADVLRRYYPGTTLRAAAQ